MPRQISNQFRLALKFGPIFLSFLMAACTGRAQGSPTLNLVFFGDSLTEGVPHFNGEPDTMPFMVNQQFPGATYAKLAYRGQTTYYLREKLDGFLYSEFKPGYKNVLVIWTGTNDFAIYAPDCVQQTFSNLVAMSRIARAAGWKVVVITTISRGNYWSGAAQQAQFPTEQAEFNNLIHSSTEFDAVADPAPQLTNPSDTTLFWDACHLFPKGYQIVANLVVAAIKSLP
jgi:lysophospholipase L1-like esterase